MAGAATTTTTAAAGYEAAQIRPTPHAPGMRGQCAAAALALVQMPLNMHYRAGDAGAVRGRRPAAADGARGGPPPPLPPAESPALHWLHW